MIIDALRQRLAAYLVYLACRAHPALIAAWVLDVAAEISARRTA